MSELVEIVTLEPAQLVEVISETPPQLVEVIANGCQWDYITGDPADSASLVEFLNEYYGTVTLGVNQIAFADPDTGILTGSDEFRLFFDGFSRPELRIGQAAGLSMGYTNDLNYIQGIGTKPLKISSKEGGNFIQLTNGADTTYSAVNHLFQGHVFVGDVNSKYDLTGYGTLSVDTTKNTIHLLRVNVGGEESRIQVGKNSTWITGMYEIRFDSGGLVKMNNVAGVNIGNASFTNQKFLRVGQGTSYMDFGEISATFGGIWFQTATPSNTNYTFGGDGVYAVVNSPSASVLLRSHGDTFFQGTSRPSVVSGGGAQFLQLTSTNNPAGTGFSAFTKYGGVFEWQAGAIATQYDTYFRTPTYSFLGASIITNAGNVVADFITAGTHATITHNAAFYNPARALTAATTNGYGGLFTAPVGAVNNWAVGTVGRLLVTNNSAGEMARFQNNIQGSHWLEAMNTGNFVNSNVGYAVYTNIGRVGKFIGQSSSVTLINSQLGIAGNAIGICGDATSILFAPNGINSQTNAMLINTNHNVLIGTNTNVASAKLTIESTTQGFLPPRMTAAQGSAIVGPAEGLVIYVTDTNVTFIAKGWWGYDGAAWQKLN